MNSLKHLTIGKYVTQIEDGAFDMASIEKLSIPNNVVSIGRSSFLNCPLKFLYYDANILDCPFSNGRFSELVIGDNVEVLYNNAFSSCGSLKKVTIGKSLEYIRNNAFSNCANIKELYSASVEPPYCYPGVFENTPINNIKLFIPEEAVDAYSTTEPWSNFANLASYETGETVIPSDMICKTPTITYSNGKINFDCQTKNATIHYEIKSKDAICGTMSSGSLNINGEYTIVAYATAVGMAQSESVSIDVELSGNDDINGDGIIDITDVTTLVNKLLIKK